MFISARCKEIMSMITTTKNTQRKKYLKTFNPYQGFLIKVKNIHVKKPI